MRLTAQLQRWLIYAAFAALTTGCTTKFYRESADKESHKAIRNKSPAVLNKDTNFTIEQTNLVSLATLPLTTNAPDFLGADAQKDAGARVLSLEDALDLAIKHNRAYQSRKERLYLTALDVTLARYRFTPIFSAGGSAHCGNCRNGRAR
jgi:hypothetical protein